MTINNNNFCFQIGFLIAQQSFLKGMIQKLVKTNFFFGFVKIFMCNKWFASFLSKWKTKTIQRQLKKWKNICWKNPDIPWNINWLNGSPWNCISRNSSPWNWFQVCNFLEFIPGTAVHVINSRIGSPWNLFQDWQSLELHF